MIHLDCLCSVSIPISVFFTHSLRDVLRKGQGTVSKRRGLLTCVRTTHTAKTSEPKSSLILTGGPSLWPFRSSVQGGYSRIRCSTVCINSTLSEDASEVLVQPLPCGTEKANSVARVVVKHTPRLCNRCASYT